MPRCNPPRRQSQNTLLPPARISFSASAQNDVPFAISAPTCSTYSCQLFSISSLNSCGSVPSRSPCWRFSGWYTTRSDTSARARRRAFCFGSCTMKGFTGRSGPVMRCPGGAPGAALGAGGAGAGAAGRTGGVVARAGGTGPAAGARTGAVGDTGGRSVGVGGAAAGAAGGATGRGGAAGAAGAAGGAGARGGVLGAETGPEKRGMPGGRGGTGTDGGGGGGAGARGAGGGGAAAAGATGAAGARWAAGTAGAAAPVAGFTGNTLLHTAQRARTPPGGTLAGSTRYTVSHDGQVTFISRPPRSHPAPA